MIARFLLELYGWSGLIVLLGLLFWGILKEFVKEDR